MSEVPDAKILSDIAGLLGELHGREYSGELSPERLAARAVRALEGAEKGGLDGAHVWVPMMGSRHARGVKIAAPGTASGPG